MSMTLPKISTIKPRVKSNKSLVFFLIIYLNWKVSDRIDSKISCDTFYKNLKRVLYHDAHFEARTETTHETTQEIFNYIENYCDTKRTHSVLDYKSPNDFEKYNS